MKRKSSLSETKKKLRRMYMRTRAFLGKFKVRILNKRTVINSISQFNFFERCDVIPLLQFTSANKIKVLYELVTFCYNLYDKYVQLLIVSLDLKL